MIGILIVIPLVVMLVVGLVTRFVSVAVNIGVEQVVLDKESITLELTGEDIYLNDLIKVTVLPEKATNKTYEWSLASVTSLDPAYDSSAAPVELLDENKQPADIVSSGYLRINTFCMFDIVVTAEAASARCLVQVKGDVTSVSVSGNSSMKTGEYQLLSAVYTPLDALVESAVWHSSDESVATVDANGVVHAVGAGSTDITVSVQGTGGNTVVSKPFSVECVLDGTLFGTSFSVHTDDIPLSAMGITAADVDSGSLDGCVLSDSTLTLTADTATFSVNGTSVTVTKCDADAIEIVSSAIFTSDGGFTLAADDKLALAVKYKSVLRDETVAGAVWTTDSEDVAVVNAEGILYGHGSGEVNVTVSAGGHSDSVRISVRRKVAYMSLKTTDESLKVGFARETVVGALTYTSSGSVKDDTYALAYSDNSMTVEIRLPSDLTGDEAVTLFDYTTDKPEYARFEGNKLIFDAEAIKNSGEERVTLTVTVKTKYPRYEKLETYTTASFTLNVVYGVEVGNDYWAMRNALENGTNVTLSDNVAVQNDPRLTSVSNGQGAGASMVTVKADIYGNGNAIYAQLNQMCSRGEPVLAVMASNVLISNVTVRANTATDGVNSIDDVAKFVYGRGISFRVTDEEPHMTGGRLEYSLIENGQILVDIGGHDVTVDGCLIRNASSVGLYVNTNASSDHDPAKLKYSNLTLNNTVMSNLVGAGFTVLYEGNYSAADYAIEDKRTVINQTGFLDLYNWQNINSLDLISSMDLEGAGINTPELRELLMSGLSQILTGADAIAPFRKTYNGETYVHLGIMSIGAFKGAFGSGNNPTYLIYDLHMEDERFDVFNTNEVDGSLMNLVKMVLSEPAYVWCYKNTVDDISPGKTYTINNSFIAHLHGEI